MQRLRDIKLTTALLAAGALVAGASAIAGDLSAAAPKNVNMTALWKINPDLSDDPQKVLAKRRQEDSGAGSTGGGGTRRSGGTRVGNADIDVGDIFGGGGTISGTIGGGRGGKRGGGADRPEADPQPAESMRVPLDSFLATREQFEIEQRPDALIISTVDETTTCKSGQTEKVSLQSGEKVDRHCGWDGGTFVVELVSDDGVKRVNRYDLRKSDKQLVLTSEIKGGHGQLRGLQIKRVYDRIVAF